MDLLWLWDAFWEVNSDRALGMGAEGRIPSVAIDAYARRHGIDDPSDFEWFRSVIRSLDSEYLSLRQRKNETGVDNARSMRDHHGIKALLRQYEKKPGDPETVAHA